MATAEHGNARPGNGRAPRGTARQRRRVALHGRAIALHRRTEQRKGKRGWGMMVATFVHAIEVAAQRAPTPAALRSLDDAWQIDQALTGLGPAPAHEPPRRHDGWGIRYASDYGELADVPGLGGTQSTSNCVVVMGCTGKLRPCPLMRECMASVLRGGSMHPDCGAPRTCERAHPIALTVTRKAAALAYIVEHPGCKRRELAAALGINRDATYYVALLLQAEGRINLARRRYFANEVQP